MPRNKEALIRYRVINRLLVNRKRVTRSELIEACQEALDKSPIGQRTIDGDIHSMRYDRYLGYDAPISYDRMTGCYYYSDPDYSIDKLPINEEELQSLAFAATTLEQFRNVEIFELFQGTVQKIVDTINLRRSSSQPVLLNFIEFERVPSYQGSEYLRPIIDAILDKKVLEITYKAFESVAEHQHIIHPYLLKEYRNYWYLIGYHEAYEAIRTYALDRIQQLRTLSGHPFRDQNFSSQKFFRNVVGITRFVDAPPPCVVLRFSRRQANYVLTQPIHNTQKIISENEEFVEIELFVHLTPEFMMMLLGWNKEVEVLEPLELREGLKSLLQEALERYR